MRNPTRTRSDKPPNWLLDELRDDPALLTIVASIARKFTKRSRPKKSSRRQIQSG